MPLTIIQTSGEQLLGACVVDALRKGVDTNGSAVLLVPSFEQALDAQRLLAHERGLALSVSTTTPAAWVRERWELWGDGRAMANPTALMVLARETVKAAMAEQPGAIELSPGVVDVLAQLVGRYLPWLPLDGQGRVCESACAEAGLTQAEARLMGLAGRLAALLSERGFVSEAEASVRVPQMLAAAGVSQAPVVVAGFAAMGRLQRELVRSLAGIAPVTLVIPAREGPASEQADELASWFGQPCVRERATASGTERAPELARLLEVLFGEALLDPREAAAVELLMPAGPVAEAELVARRVGQLVGEEGASSVAVAVPDVARARRELVPKLVSRGLTVRLAGQSALLDIPAARDFFAFARMVAHLAELDEAWPAPEEGIDGTMASLGDMGWWPPRDLTDFLLSDVAHVAAERAWWTDAVWRGNRLLAPARVLAMLQSERDTSPAVARATAELLRGRLGTAASKLLLPFVEALSEGGAAPDEHAGEAQAALQAILQLAGSLRELGVTTDPSAPNAVPLSELVEVAQWAANGVSVSARVEAGMGEGAPVVSLVGLHGAAHLAPASVDALVVCGLTTAECPLGAGDDLLTALLELLSVEPPANPMAHARADFAALVAAPRRRLVLERALHDGDSRPTYPSVMLSELLAAYGISSTASFDEVGLPKAGRPETLLAENLSPAGTAAHGGLVSEPAPAGRLTEASRGLVFVPQEGSAWQPDERPVLSASQVEAYLECPYKWFSLRRLRLGTVDAGHGGMEMGTFAHRVLEVTHRELLARALEKAQPGVAREELLAAIEADPARHVAGSRIEPGALEEASDVLSHEFELHRQHMYMVRRPRLAQQLLVAHDAAERAQEERLREDLLSSLAYQTGILQGFEPRLFEWSFGRHGNLVEYAGAYFTGTVDRIDVSPHGTAVIVDYKHKSPAGFAAEYDALQPGVLEGELLPNRVQSLIYAQVVRRAFEGRLRLVGSVYLSTKSPHALAGVADENVADHVFGRLSARRLPRVSVPRTAEGQSGMDALLDRTEELVAEQVRQMMAGRVEARPRDAHACDFCPVMQCERRMGR